MTGLAVIFFLAAIGFGVSRWLRLPVIPLLLAEGVLISAFGFGTESHDLEFVVQLGLTFLVFSVGIELNPKRVQTHRNAVLWVGCCQLFFAATVGVALSWLFGFRSLEILYLGFALSTSSTLVVVRHLKMRQQMFEPFGRMVLGALLFQDVVMLLLIIFASRYPEGWMEIAKGLGSAVLCAGLAYMCQRYWMPKLLTKTKPDSEALLLIILALLFAFIGLVHQLGLPPFAGAFMAGFSLSAFPVNGLVRSNLNSLSDFFIAVFFVGLGFLVELPDGGDLFKAIAFALAVILLTPPIVTVIAEWKGLSSRASIETGLLLAQNSEFSLILAYAGVRSGHISDSTFSIITAFTVITMMCTPFIATDRVTRFLLHFHPVRRKMNLETNCTNHVLMLGFGSGGMWVLKPLLKEGHPILVVDDDPVVISQLQRMNVPCIHGDGSDEKVLIKAGVTQAKLVLASMRRAADAEKVLRLTKDIPTIVRVFEQRDADWIRSLGGIPILNSEASLATFSDWFDQTEFTSRHSEKEPA